MENAIVRNSVNTPAVIEMPGVYRGCSTRIEREQALLSSVGD
jgi:hypothetical protein